MKTFAFVVLLLFITGCGTFVYRTEGPALVEPVIPTLFTDTVTRGDVLHKELHAGVIRYVSRPLQFDMEEDAFAIVERIYVQAGDRVTTGQLLARLDVEHILEVIEQKRDSIAQMRRTNELNNHRQALVIANQLLEHAELVQRAAETFDLELFDRAARLEDSIQLQQLALAQAIELQNWDLQEANRLLANTRGMLYGTSLYSPVNGIVTAVNIWQGAVISDETYVLYIADENQSQVVQYAGDSLRLDHIRYFVRMRAYINGASFELEFLNLTPVERELYTMQNIRQGRFINHVFPVRFNILSDYSLPLGSFVNLHLYHIFMEDVLRLPRTALHSDRYGDYVLLYLNGIQEQVYVEAVHSPTYVAILDGLEEGDVVIVTR